MLIEIAAAITLIALIFWSGVRRKRREEEQSQMILLQINRTFMEERAALAQRWPAPTYEMPDDPVYGPLFREFIAKMVPPWIDYFDDRIVNEEEVLKPYLAAGKALTDRIREEILDEARCRKYLKAVENAKEAARRSASEAHWKNECAERERLEAIQKIQEFKERSGRD